MSKGVITFGTYDIFHVGHMNILERCASLGDTLIVGISTDQLNFDKKQRNPVYSQEDRMKIVQALSFVDEVFFEHSLEKKREYIEFFRADMLAMGDDWKGRLMSFQIFVKLSISLVPLRFLQLRLLR